MPYVKSVPESTPSINNRNSARRWTVLQDGARDTYAGTKERHIKVLPELARLSYLAGLGTTFIVWTLLRYLDKSGTGYVEREFGLRALSKFGIGRKKIYRAVKAQERLEISLFEIHDTRISYSSHVNVAARLGATRALQPRGIPESAFGNISNFYAQTFAAWISAVGDRNKDDAGLMMSREKLSCAWGISDTQQRTWERKTGVRVQANVGRFDTPAQDDESAATKRLIAALPRNREHEARCWEHGGVTYFQTVNTYVTPFAVLFRMGASAKAAAAARHAKRVVEPVECLPTGSKPPERVFFRKAWLLARPYTMSVKGGSSLLEAGEAISTTRIRRNRGTGTLERYTTHLAVYDVCSMRPRRRGEALL